VAKNATNARGLMSICTKVVVQVNAKLGGEPWTVSVPLKVGICSLITVFSSALLRQGGQMMGYICDANPFYIFFKMQNLMVIGFDVYHCGKRKNASVGAMVASTNSHLSKYYSTISFHNSREELSTNLCSDMASKCKCI